MQLKQLSFLTAFGLVLMAAPMTVLALGGGSGSSSSGSEKPACKSGYIYSEKKKRCVRKTSSELQRSDLLQHAWNKAYDGEYEEAREIFQSLVDQPSAEVFNGLGYSHRKLGQLESGIGFYKRAIALEPDYVLARSYLGEGYVSSGRIDLARQELAEIGQRCGKTCREYVYLLRAIETGVANDW